VNFAKFTKRTGNGHITTDVRHNGRRYTEHPACLETDYPDIETPSGIKERIGFLDVETQLNFNANFSVMLTWAVKPLNEKLSMTFLQKKIL